MNLYFILIKLFNIYYIILTLRILISWLAPYSRNGFTQLIFDLTEPLLAPIRRALPLKGLPIDFSPIVLIFILRFLLTLILRVIY